MSEQKIKKPSSPDTTDRLAGLIHRIRNNDTRAFRTLFKMFYEPLVRHAYRYVRNPQAAEDIVSDIFLKIWEKRHELTINKSVKAYLYSMVRNHSLNYLKRNRLETSDIYSLDIRILSDNSPEKSFQISELKEHIEKAIIELPKRTREVFVMHRYDNLKYSEIAEILNIKEGTVETHMVRALRYLRNRLAFLLTKMAVIG